MIKFKQKVQLGLSPYHIYLVPNYTAFENKIQTFECLNLSIKVTTTTRGLLFSKRRRVWRKLAGLTKIRQQVSRASFAFFKAA